MEISGYVTGIFNEKLILELSGQGKKQTIDVFLSENRKLLLDKHIVVKGSLVKFSIILQSVDVKGDQLGKFWLNYIIFPTVIEKREPERSKDDGRGNWAEARVKNK